MNPRKKVILTILDGWGNGNSDHTNAIFRSKTPVFDKLLKKYPNAQLLTDGENVGLPKGQMGNSEVGHLNIGAGRVVYQELLKINRSIESGDFFKNRTLMDAMNYAKSHNKAVHFIGLVSDGGIHSHQEHLIALCDMASTIGVQQSYIHAFTDGRDTDPKHGIKCLKYVEEKIKHTNTKFASIVGRYFAMDRDLRWERIKKAYDLLVHRKGKFTEGIEEAFTAAYEKGITDEFMEPTVLVDESKCAKASIQAEDIVICFNYRTDRCRQISRALFIEDIEDHQMRKLPLYYCTMTRYDQKFKEVRVVFEKDNLKNTLGEVISQNNMQQIRAAETEKYPHVTFFFSGGREELFPGEQRIMVNSPKVATYDLQPEMSAEELTQKLLSAIENSSAEFICLNYANPDMVGHTGDFDAIVKAVEKVDQCLGRIVNAATQQDYSMIITADHGNADNAVNPDGSPNTAHSLNPVPVIILDRNVSEVNDGILANIAPTVLKLLNIDIPAEMTKKTLIG
ncbi:MAG: phosphoglycerate mutase (2,3-diphosphoglycerate-independent) [Verrucomicrobia bacterium]|nr:phosphoglycerate mutase (2,3-diphosphoglycerate-independent) [Verrucomicrobiota bacterium]